MEQATQTRPSSLTGACRLNLCAMASDRWLSVDDVAEYLGVTRFTVYRWIEGRGLPAHKRGKMWLLRQQDIDRWVLLGQKGASRTDKAAPLVDGLQVSVEAPLFCMSQDVKPGSVALEPPAGDASPRTRTTDQAGLLDLSPHPDTSMPEAAKSSIGVVMGLAAGVDMPVRFEAMPLTGRGQIVPTGVIVRVMPESASQAAAYIRSNIAGLNVSPAALSLTDIAVIAEVGDIPVQADTLGAAVAVCLASALGGIRLRRWTATAGRLEPDGSMAPVGDLASRLRAAVRGGIRDVFLPRENAAEAKALPYLGDVPLRVVPVGHVNEVIQLAQARGQLDMFKMAGGSDGGK